MIAALWGRKWAGRAEPRRGGRQGARACAETRIQAQPVLDCGYEASRSSEMDQGPD